MAVSIIAHRGSNKVAPQNTLPAFRQAIAEGTDGFETDVHVTKDGKLVICHNYTVDATSDGRGAIADYTLGELKKMDFGSYFSDEFKNTPPPSVDEFLDLVDPTGSELVNIELKCPMGGETGIEQKTVLAIKQHGMIDRCLISSFNAGILKNIKTIEPRLRTGFLYPTIQHSVSRFVVNPFLIVKRIHADFIHPMYPVVTPLLVKTAHKLGVGVNVWTVDDEKTVQRLIDCGVDGIITDVPGKARAWADAYEEKKRK
ncbi:MAG: glycerophosphodiester phosphodiesterase [Clostridia bacterium]|nr:glycerophosphodiester phosphodiesterase [Clostridia bacterium]